MSRAAASSALLAVERVRLLLDEAEARDRAAIDERLAGPEGETRRRLVQLFALAPEEIDALDCAVAVAVEPALGPRIAALQGLPGRLLPTIVALRRLFGHGAAPLPRSGSPLLGWYLVSLHARHPGEPAMIEADPAIVEWYFGLPSLAGIEGLAITRAREVEPLAEWGVEAAASGIRAALDRGTPVRVVVTGHESSGRSSLAAALARALGHRPLLVAPVRDQAVGIASVARVQRLALLMDAVAPVWRSDPRDWPPGAMLAPLQFVVTDAEAELPRIDGVVDVVLPMPALEPASRDKLARRLLPAAVSASLSPLGAPRLGDLADAAALGIDDPRAFHDLLRQRTRERVQGVGHIVTTRFGWDDLILPAPVKALLRAIEREARQREALLARGEARRLFEGTAALTAMFAGPPGTGKSMAGQVLAGALSLDLLVIDTSAISSKFIGETAKNFTRAFAVAREANCGIMFEEADGMFARRVENDSVNARHANADTGHLLQLVEQHRHLVMLSTNRPGAIDQAFRRRLRFIVDFPLPDRPERVQLWERMLTALGERRAAAAKLAGEVADAQVASAAQIKSAALTAAFLAREEGRRGISADLLRAGIARELAKEGRIGEIVMPGRGRRAHG
jgi:hypothetical protein